MQLQYSHSSGPSLVPVQRPRCPKCDERMSLARFPGPSAFDIGTFECAGCHLVHAAAVETDPMKSAAVLWLASHDLRPPT
jgi:hypothetical protein